MEVVKNKEELNKKRDKENPDKLQPERENTMKEIPGKKYSIDSINIEAFNLKTDQRICKNCLKVTLDNSKCNGCHLQCKKLEFNYDIHQSWKCKTLSKKLNEFYESLEKDKVDKGKINELMYKFLMRINPDIIQIPKKEIEVCCKNKIDFIKTNPK